MFKLVRHHPAIRLLQWELGLWTDLIRWTRGQLLIPEHATPLPHQPGRIQFMTALTAAVVLEAIAVDFLISQRLIRIIALVIAVYSVVMIWALIAAERIRPSYVGDQLVLRRGRRIFAKVPPELIKVVTKERTFAEQVSIDNNTLTLGGTHGTDTTITLSHPVEALRDTYPWQRRRTTPVTRIRLYTDGILDATNFRN